MGLFWDYYPNVPMIFPFFSHDFGSEVQQMRLTGATLAGEPLHPALVWPWKGLLAVVKLKWR